MKAPKAPEPTAQELAGVARQSRMIDEAKEDLEKRLKAQTRGKSGSKSLLAKGGKVSGKSGGSGRSMMVGSSSGAGSSGRGGGMSGGGSYGGSNFNKR